MKYKVGDKVRVKENLPLQEKYTSILTGRNHRSIRHSGRRRKRTSRSNAVFYRFELSKIRAN